MREGLRMGGAPGHQSYVLYLFVKSYETTRGCDCGLYKIIINKLDIFCCVFLPPLTLPQNLTLLLV